MRAVVVERWMEPAELRVSEVPEPVVEAGSVVVDVHAAGCNFFDVLLVQGKYQVKPAFPFIPGAEVAGTVSALGEGVTTLSLGQRVMASLPYGAFAERVLVPAGACVSLPAAMSFTQGAAFPIVYPTSHAALVHRARVQAGETVLVTAAAGGVGLSSIQIAKALGARVIALAGGAEKLDVARAAGADVALDYGAEGWVDAVREATGGRGVDVVIENVGGDVFEGALKSLAWGGRLIVVGFAGGKIPEIRANRILLKHIAVIGLHWGPMAIQEPDQVRASHAELAAWFEQGKLRPEVWRTFEPERVSEALGALASRKTWGKVVLAFRP